METRQGDSAVIVHRPPKFPANFIVHALKNVNRISRSNAPPRSKRKREIERRAGLSLSLSLSFSYSPW